MVGVASWDFFKKARKINGYRVVDMQSYLLFSVRFTLKYYQNLRK